jgi:GNAT superfamily N-acetyltransferase
MWRIAGAHDDDKIVSMCLALNADDPGHAPVRPEQVLRTLAKLRDEPHRGRAVVCEVDGDTTGYALLISFWSNELGGEVCVIDELFVVPEYRSRGVATELLASLIHNKGSLSPAKSVALGLEVSPANVRARALYERVGFRGSNLVMQLPLAER